MRVGAVIAAAAKSGGYKSYDKMKSVDGIQVLRQMILNFKRAGVDEIVLITGYQAEQVEKVSMKFFEDNAAMTKLATAFGFEMAAKDGVVTATKAF